MRKIVCHILVMFSFVFITFCIEAASPQLHIDVGLNHFYKKRYLEAFKEFKAAVDKDPKNAEAQYNLGRVYHAQGFLKEALVQYQIAVNINPNYLAARRAFDELRSSIAADVKTQLKISGQEEAQRIRELEFDNTTADQRGQELLRQGKTSDAIAAFEEASRQDPFNPRLFKLLGFLHFRQNKYATAVANYQQAQKLAPNDPEIHYALGLIRMKTSEIEVAISDFNRALSQEPKMLKAHYALGEAYEALGRFDDAIFQFRHCLELNSDLKEAQNKLKDLGQKMSYNYFTRGSALFQQADYQSAEALLSIAIQYGSLTESQARQANEMLGAARYWTEKRKTEDKILTERSQIRQDATLGRTITIEDVIRNPTAYIGQSINWTGSVVFSDAQKGKDRYYANTNARVDPNANMDFTFGVTFPKALPQDPRVSVYSTTLHVKGKIVGVEKIFNNTSMAHSSNRQPIVEASEAVFIRQNYDQPLVLRYY